MARVELVAYAVCPRCGEVAPSGSPCPCRDASSVDAAAARRAGRVDEAARARRARARIEAAWFEAPRVRSSRLPPALFGLALFAGLMLLLVALTRA
jgi:hypothetical protein